LAGPEVAEEDGPIKPTAKCCSNQVSAAH
jgi:hypothetical protein